MLRLIKLVLLAIIMIGLVTVSLANSEPVTLYLLPTEIQSILPVSVELPMFAVILCAVLVGLLLGYILEWLREHRHRREARERRREAKVLAQQVDTLKRKHVTEEEEVLSILDNAVRKV